jgi:hypothetical protein
MPLSVSAVHVPVVFLRRALVAVLAAAVLLCGRPLAAQGDFRPVRAAVLTFGPGDHPFFKFGHNAILIEDERGRGTVYNFGTFTFDSPLLIPKFLRGRLTYWLSLSGRDDALYGYRASNRTIEIQELDLTEDQIRLLDERLRENALPQNREYLYDYFWDNCSTRVRDAIDAVVDGRVRVSARAPAPQTFRAHALRMTADLFPEYLGLHFGLGSFTDTPTSLWEEAFLPERLRDLLRLVRVPAEGGGEKPLVRSERVLFAADRPEKPARPPQWSFWFGLTGLLAGGGLAGLGVLARRGRRARFVLGAATSVLGLIFGLLGLILVLLWMLTNHRAAHANENILQAAPWALALVGYGLGVARGRERAIRRAFWVAASAAAASILGLLLKVLPGFFLQDNVAFVALLLPLWMGLALGLLQLGGKSIRLPRWWRAKAATTYQSRPPSC